jgi:hypothetical protein
MGQIKVTLTGDRQLSIPLQETDDGPVLAERIAKRVNNVNLSGNDCLVELKQGKYVLASLIRQVWFTDTQQLHPPEPVDDLSHLIRVDPAIQGNAPRT